MASSSARGVGVGALVGCHTLLGVPGQAGSPGSAGSLLQGMASSGPALLCAGCAEPKAPAHPQLRAVFCWKLIFSSLWSSKWPGLLRVGAHAAIFLTLH